MLNSRDIDRLRPDVAANCRAWLELCRAADADTKKAAVGLLKGESSGFSDTLGICPAAQAPGRATFSARCLTAS